MIQHQSKEFWIVLNSLTVEHPDNVTFSELYYQYLSEDKYLTAVTDFGVIRTNSLGSVHNHLNFFYATSKMSKRKIEKVDFDEKLAVFMLNTALDYVQKEKSLLKNYFEEYNTEQKFEYIGELTALIYIQAIDKGFEECVNSKVNEIWQILDENQIVTDAIRMDSIVCVWRFLRILFYLRIRRSIPVDLLV